MVLRGVEEEEEEEEEEDEDTEPMSPTPSPKRRKPIHNFTLPLPKWGTQRNLTCSNTAFTGTNGASTSADRRFSLSNFHQSTERRQVVEGIAVAREKLLHELENDADRMKESSFGEENETLESWNMKMKQKREFKPPITSSGNAKRDFTSPARIDDAAGDTFDHVLLRLRSNIKNNKIERPKFSVQLLRKEIEEDCMALMGRGPRQRPTKRPRNVQKQIDKLFPGLWLREVNAEMYEVHDTNQNGRSGKRKGIRNWLDDEESTISSSQ